jgi:hypothetical protein
MRNIISFCKLDVYESSWSSFNLMIWLPFKYIDQGIRSKHGTCSTYCQLPVLLCFVTGFGSRPKL